MTELNAPVCMLIVFQKRVSWNQDSSTAGHRLVSQKGGRQLVKQKLGDNYNFHRRGHS